MKRAEVGVYDGVKDSGRTIDEKGKDDVGAKEEEECVNIEK